MSLEIFILDSFRVGFSAIKINGSSHTDLIFDSGFMSRVDFSINHYPNDILNPFFVIDPDSTSGTAWWTYIDTIPAHTGYQDIDQFDGAYSNAIVSCNRNYHRPIIEHGQFSGYETGSISISGSHTRPSPPDSADFWLAGDAIPDESIAPDATGIEISMYSYGFAGMTFPAGFINVHTEPANANTSIYEGTVPAGHIDISAQVLQIPREQITINAKNTPYAQTSVKRIYFTNSTTAMAFYRYTGADYKQVLVKGTGNIWYGLGDGYIDKALIFNDYAWVYISGNKYLCRSIGGCLNVY